MQSAVAPAAVVLAADQGYFFLAQGLVRSLQDNVLPQRPLELICLDIGLDEASVAWMAEQGVRVVKADASWAPDVVRACIAPHPYMLAQVLRPYLPRLTEAEVIVHLDCDTWLQNDGLFDAALDILQRQPTHIALSPSSSHYSSTFYNNLQKLLDIQYNWTYACYDKAMAEELARMAFFSSGVFAARRDSPVWALWAAEIERILPRVAMINPSMLHLAEQTALNAVVRLHNLVSVLDPIFNFHCNSGGAMRDADTDKVVTSLVFPIREVGVVHLAAWSKCGSDYQAQRLTYGA